MNIDTGLITTNFRSYQAVKKGEVFSYVYHGDTNYYIKGENSDCFNLSKGRKSSFSPDVEVVLKPNAVLKVNGDSL